MSTPTAMPHVMNTYGRLPFALSHGRGCRVWDTEGREYLDGLAGIVTHVQGVRKRPGGFEEAHYNLVMGPPLLAPGSLCVVGALGLAAAIVQRER